MRVAVEMEHAVAPGSCPSCGLVNPGPEHSANRPLLCAETPRRVYVARINVRGGGQAVIVQESWEALVAAVTDHLGSLRP